MIKKLVALNFAWTYGLTKSEALLVTATYYRVQQVQRWRRNVTKEHMMYYVLKFKATGTPLNECMRQARAQATPMTIQQFHDDMSSKDIYD